MKDVKQFRSDSYELIRTFNAIGNRQSQHGTSYDRGNQASINLSQIWLSEQELSMLPRKNGLIRRAIELYPTDALRVWFNLGFGKDDTVDTDAIMNYLKNLGNLPGSVKVKYGFLSASIQARQFGQAFILIGVADGKDLSEPIDKTKIRSIRWLKIFSPYEMKPDGITDPLVYCRILESDTLVHKDRILEFSGNKIHNFRAYAENGYTHDSMITGMYDAFQMWYQGLMASSSMLTDYDVFTFGIKGMGAMVYQDNQKNDISNQNALASRGVALSTGKSTLKTLMYDLENELPGSVNRTYSGADSIMNVLEGYWASVTDLPKSKLFNMSGGSGLSHSVNAAQILRFEYTLALNNWQQKNWSEPMIQLLELVMSAKDCIGTIPDGWTEQSVIFPINEENSTTENMQIELIAAQRAQILDSIGAITPEEIRNQYDNAEFNPNIQLLDGWTDPEKFKIKAQLSMQSNMNKQSSDNQDNQDNQVNQKE